MKRGTVPRSTMTPHEAGDDFSFHPMDSKCNYKYEFDVTIRNLEAVNSNTKCYKQDIGIFTKMPNTGKIILSNNHLQGQPEMSGCPDFIVTVCS